ncbi:hypothetical protein D018_1731 [Vibrio parahaemolyticus VP2007-007]|nr:hypothetical protein D018_1731 [Vibrio parahaemolyticus VP2007-007]
MLDALDAFLLLHSWDSLIALQLWGMGIDTAFFNVEITIGLILSPSANKDDHLSCCADELL